MARVLFPLPDHDFDVTEVSVPWKLISEAGHEVIFATENGATPAADPLLLKGGMLGARPEPLSFYRQLETAASFRSPIRWSDISVDRFDALFLAGGHAPGMRQYLGNELLQSKVAEIFAAKKPTGAICHGVIVLARANEPSSGRSSLYERKTTCLPKYMERTAYFSTFWYLGRYYRTYPEYVEDEVISRLARPSDFERGPLHLMSRGTRDDDREAFVVEDNNYVSARWPGDAYLIAKKMIARLAG
ncbi:MAG: type 1 glutamine amidotransferase domain-containing protein [Polyangiaceae bacterium]